MTLFCKKTLDEKRLVTDDRPYIRGIDFDNYEMLPAAKKLENNRYYRSWIKITTLDLCVCCTSSHYLCAPSDKNPNAACVYNHISHYHRILLYAY